MHLNVAGHVRRGRPEKVAEDMRLSSLSTRDVMEHTMEQSHVTSGPTVVDILPDAILEIDNIL